MMCAGVEPVGDAPRPANSSDCSHTLFNTFIDPLIYFSFQMFWLVCYVAFTNEIRSTSQASKYDVQSTMPACGCLHMPYSCSRFHCNDSSCICARWRKELFQKITGSRLHCIQQRALLYQFILTYNIMTCHSVWWHWYRYVSVNQEEDCIAYLL